MNIDKLNDEEKLSLCRRFFYCGFALLPLLWLVNAVWFFRQAFGRSSFVLQKKIRMYVLGSLIGVVLWAIALTAWTCTYQAQRIAWGAIGDYLSLVIPLGFA